MKKFLIGAALAGAMVFGGVAVTPTSAQIDGPYDMQPAKFYGADQYTCFGTGSACLFFVGNP